MIGRLLACAIALILFDPFLAKASSIMQPDPNCQWGDGIYKSVSGQKTESPDIQYQFEFLSRGLTAGGVRFSQYQNGKLNWVSEGNFGCSNGASVCSILIESNAESDSLIDIPFEQLTASNGETFLVMPAFAQTAYRAQGLRVVSHNDWKPEIKNTETAPNIYVLSTCKKPSNWNMQSNLDSPEAAEGGYCELRNAEIIFSYFRNGAESEDQKGFVMVTLTNSDFSEVKKRIIQIDNLKPEVIEIKSDGGDFGEFNSIAYDEAFFESMAKGGRLLVEELDGKKLEVSLDNVAEKIKNFTQCVKQANLQ
jgi:hypothetical protein